MIEVSLREGAEHIDLCDALKVAGLVDNGAEGKHVVGAGKVKVDGVVETRKRCKIRLGQVIEFMGKKICIRAS